MENNLFKRNNESNQTYVIAEAGLNHNGSIDIAKKLVNGREINYFIDDMNNLKNIPIDNYDAIFNVGVLHHVFRLTKTIWTLYSALKKDGLMFNFEYVGPSQNQYSDEHLKIIKQINE